MNKLSLNSDRRITVLVVAALFVLGVDADLLISGNSFGGGDGATGIHLSQDATACPLPDYETLTPESYDSDVIVTWMNVLKNLTTGTPGFSPPVAARAFGYIGLALNEAVQVGSFHGKSVSGMVNNFTLTTTYDENRSYHWPSVVNSVFAKMTTSLYFTAAENSIFSLIAETEALFQTMYADTDPTARITSREYADDLATKILAYALNDGGHAGQLDNFPTPFDPAGAETNNVTENYIMDGWQPTVPGRQSGLQPSWGANRPFLNSNLDIDGIVNNTIPMAVTNSSFDMAAQKVYDTVNGLTEEQKIIAEYWSDDPETTATPPGHSISILNQLIEAENVNLADAAKQFGMLGMAVNDAFISCWKTKYETNYPRPVTFINDNINATWKPILITPPFPEYTSGHSVQSGALASVLNSLYGANKNFTDNTHMARNDINGTPRYFSTFNAMALEAAASRLYGGIHYDEAIDLGLVQGKQIGNNIVALFA